VSELRALENRRKTESETLNRQLSQARENQKKSEQLFNEYEAGQFLLMSQKDTQIVTLKAENKGKDRVILRLIIVVVALGLGVIIPIIIKVVMKFRVA
jgi:hypothetical protein